MRAFQPCLIAVFVGATALGGCSHGAGHATGALSPSALAQKPSPKLEALARRALDDASLADELRAEGPLGLDALLSQAKAAGRLDASLDPLIDRVAGQRYARYSGLYWYTDLDAAIARAEAEHKPILSLRLLGDLRDDLSCANSRYFRVVLYPDPVVGDLLRAGFVLHWSSERPVPKVTVDYGDGRKLVRTVTGNSIHYVLDAHGRTVDAIPGLMAARPFAGALSNAAYLAHEVENRSDSEFSDTLRARHAERELELLARWQREFRAVGVSIENRDPAALSALNARLRSDSESLPESSVDAARAGNLAATKAVVEVNLLEQMTPKAPFSATDARRQSTLATWAKVAARHRSEAVLSEPSRALMRELAPRGFDVDGHAVPIDDAGFAALVDRFEQVLALDSVRNQLDLAIGIHERLAARPLDSLAELNRWVYATVFLTPRSDPWLGLTADRGFTALPSDGIAQAK